MTVEEIGQRLGLHASRVRRLITDGGKAKGGGRVQLKAVKVIEDNSPSWRYEVAEDDFLAFVEQWDRSPGNPRFGSEIMGRNRMKKETKEGG